MKKFSALAIACMLTLQAHAMDDLFSPWLTPWVMPDGTVQYKKAAFQIEAEERRAGRDPQAALDAHYREIGGIIASVGFTGTQVENLQQLIKRARASHHEKREEEAKKPGQCGGAPEEDGEDFSDLPPLLTPEEVDRRKNVVRNAPRTRKKPRTAFERTIAQGFAAAISREESCELGEKIVQPDPADLDALEDRKEKKRSVKNTRVLFYNLSI